MCDRKGCVKCLSREVKSQHETVCCLCSNQKKIKRQVYKLQHQLDQILSVLNISSDGESVTIGTPEDPIDNIFAKNIVGNDYSMKGVTLDDTTMALTPSFDSFPKDWLIVDAPISMCRTYHYTLNTPAWIRWFVENGIKVMVGITLSDYQNELEAFAADYNSDIDFESVYDDNIIAIAIGNEQPPNQTLNIKNGIQYARTLINNTELPRDAKVTTVLKGSTQWIKSTFPPSEVRFTSLFHLLSPALDIVCFNLYDGYMNSQLPLDVRLSWMSDLPDNEFSTTLNKFGAIRFAMKSADINVPFWVTEFGWESVPGEPGASVPNLLTYYNNFLNFNMEPFYPQDSQHTVASPERLFYFTIRDTDNETFGLYKDEQELDPKF